MKRTHCDTCGKDLSGGAEDHYTLRMEAKKAEIKPELTNGDFHDAADSDSVREMTLLLQESSFDEEVAEPQPLRLIRKDFDFCGNCYAKFASDPLGTERVSHRRFSPN